MNTVLPEASTATPDPRAQRTEQAPDGFSRYYTAGAAYIANGLEEEALRTDDVAATLRACADSLPEVMPKVFRNLNMNEALLPPLQPRVAERLRFLAALHEIREGAAGAYASVLDELLAAVRQGAEIVLLCDRVLDILHRVAASRAENTGVTA
jgi:hypothetical protein